MDAFVQCQVDVLIVGAGPAGCMAASTLARYGIDFRLMDKRAARTQAGHSSGVYNNPFMPLPLLMIE
jgi:phenol 2-monooxygenase (NADPH)